MDNRSVTKFINNNQISKKMEEEKKHYVGSTGVERKSVPPCSTDKKEIQFLHKNVVIKSEKQSGAQGSVFYINWGKK